jgi:Fe-S-cluster-containing dehydrogenase component
MKAFVFDHDKCNGCYNCQIACKDEHCANEWLPYAKPQPMTGAYWMRLTEKTHGQVPKVRVEYRPIPCQHCENAVCMEKSDAFYRREDGLVILDPQKAGDESILNACPYGAIYWNADLGIAQKCTGCAHLIDAGEVPHCVLACPLDALKFGEVEEFADSIQKAETLNPEFGTKPQVYYLNMPHLFAAGDVWDPEANEVIIGASVTLISGDKVWKTTSDEYGDFWFRRIDAGEYHLLIEAEGFNVVKKDFKLEESLNLGDFPLTK